jgi:thiamine biosynthesis protein ThiS
VQIQLNGKPRDIPEQTSVSDLIRLLNLAEERVAIELNRLVVRRAEWPTTILREGDRAEIVHFVGGGRVIEDCQLWITNIES